MKKDHIRDYATEAFRYYAYMNTTYEMLCKKYRQEALEEYQRNLEGAGTGISKPTENAVIYAESKLREKQGELWDILAVEKTIAQLNIWERRAIEIVYFPHAHRDIQKGEISDRVNQASIEIPAGTATVYRYLKRARNLFAFERGLRK